MAIKLTADSFVSVIRQSGLVAAEELNRLIEEFRGSGIDTENSRVVADELISRGKLTSWQADKLLQGKHKGFFLGKYRLLRLLGKGGMSSVFLAEHTLMRRRCAIKVLPTKRVNDSSYLGRFHREAQAVAALDHPNIVRAYDVDHEVDKDIEIHFLVMEYVEGRSLQEVVQQDGLVDFDKAAEMIRQSAEGLSHAHHAGMVHRDIKPGNLLIDNHGVIKLLDLGLARFFADDGEQSLTVAHDEKVLGTADYLAPEQALDSHSVDARADIYSLGCTMYFLLTGHPPFTEGTLAQRLMAHQQKQPPPVTKDRPDTPPNLVAILDRMMAKNPADRFQTAKDVAQALATWRTGGGPTTVEPSRAQTASDPVISIQTGPPRPAPGSGTRRPGSGKVGSGMQRPGSGKSSRAKNRSSSVITPPPAPSSETAPEPSAPAGGELAAFLTSLSGPDIGKTSKSGIQKPPSSDVSPPAMPEDSSKPLSVSQDERPPEVPPSLPGSDRDLNPEPPVVASEPAVVVPDPGPSSDVADSSPFSFGFDSNDSGSSQSGPFHNFSVGTATTATRSVKPRSRVVAVKKEKAPASPEAIRRRNLIVAGVGTGLLVVLAVWGLSSLFSGGPEEPEAPETTQQNGGSSAEEAGSDPRKLIGKEIVVGPDGQFDTINAALQYVIRHFVNEGDRSQEQVIRVRPGTWAERIVVDANDVGSEVLVPDGIRLVSDPKNPAILAPTATGPVVALYGVNRFTLEGFRLKADGKSHAIKMGGYLSGSTLRDLTISGFTAAGISAENAVGWFGEDSHGSNLITLERITFDGGAQAVGIELQKSSARFRMLDCRFLGATGTGIAFEQSVTAMTVLGCIFANAQTGIRFAVSDYADVRIDNNTFYKLTDAIVFQTMPTSGSDLRIRRNLFADIRGQELAMKAGNAASLIPQFVGDGRNFNATTRTPSGTSALLFEHSGRPRAQVSFAATDPKSENFLKPKPLPDPPAAAEGLRPQFGAVNPG